jgi:hypothetical protein
MTTPAIARRPRLLVLLCLLALAVPPAVLAPAPTADAATAHCGIAWGSLPKHGSDHDRHVTGVDGGIAAVRAGRHACHDRLVIDLAQPGTQWWVAYVDAVRSGGSGDVVPTVGGARLQVSVGAAEYVVTDPATGTVGVLYQPADRTRLVGVDGFRTFREVTYGGSFEGQHDVGLGVRARLPFRVFHLDGPGEGSRLVIDVAHRWS